jgi:hypothetical protein
MRATGETREGLPKGQTPNPALAPAPNLFLRGKNRDQDWKLPEWQLDHCHRLLVRAQSRAGLIEPALYKTERDFFA